MIFREALLKISITSEETSIENTSEKDLEIIIGEDIVAIKAKSEYIHSKYLQNTTA
ncbi:MAG: hypothetical protein DRI71_01610 [Bacteroidetes bacterium]|nr:MAG: hypothetical protein DRI71_01610 [Bacteroidota bacterium]